MPRLWSVALVAATLLFPSFAVPAEVCRECYIWEKPKVGPDIAKVWCCFLVRYEIEGSVAQQDIVSVRKMMASLSKVTGLTFDGVATGGDLFIVIGPNAYENLMQVPGQASEFARFDLAHPTGVLEGTVKAAISAKSPCLASSLEDDSHTVHSAIVATTTDLSTCLSKTLENTFGLLKPSGGKKDSAVLCTLYASYHRFARSYDDMNELVRNSALDCTQS